MSPNPYLTPKPLAPGKTLPPKPVQHISELRLDILALLCQGYTSEQIAKQLHYTRATIKYHIKQLTVICRASNVTELAYLAGHYSLIEFEDA